MHGGVDPDQIMKALRTGRLRRMQRGIYVHREDEASPLAIARAAVLASGVSDAVASHRTAARVHGIPIPPGTFAEQVTVQRAQRRIQRRELVFHGRAMGIGDVMMIDRVPVTSPARTLVDLAGSFKQLPAVWAIDDALRRGLTDRRAIGRSLAQRPSAPGETRARDRIRQADGRAESILETAGRLALADAGLRLPIPQYQVDDGAGFVAFLDGAYPDDMVGLEFDGHGPHSRPEAIFRDRQRQNSLMRLGWTILRFTWWDVMYGTSHYVAQVRDAITSAAA
ncbi:MAG: hypothetical protein ACRDQB_14205 [Thermocrispum sp.]